MRLRQTVRALLLIFALSLIRPAAAQEAASTGEQAPNGRAYAEIDHLIGLVRLSPCIFLRNGTPYRGPEAAAHIADKYDYFRDEIKTAEDFIDHAASHSLLSGRPYQVSCPGAATVLARDWLRAALEAYRNSRQPSGAP